MRKAKFNELRVQNWTDQQTLLCFIRISFNLFEQHYYRKPLWIGQSYCIILPFTGASIYDCLALFNFNLALCSTKWWNKGENRGVKEWNGETELEQIW